MTTPGLKKIVFFVLLMPMLITLLTGCWDNMGIEQWFITTGISLDAAADSDQVEIALQIGKSQRAASGSEEGGTAESSIIVLKATSDTIMKGLTELSRNSNRDLLLHHNQVLLFGTPLAEQGVGEHIDLFMRDQQSRLEVSVIVVEGSAEKALSAKLAQEKISGIFLSEMMSDMEKISQEYRVRLLDFASRLLDETTSPLAPIIKVEGEDEKQEIKMTGMAVFKGDRMIGRLDQEEILGYIWAMGDVKKCNIEARHGSDRAVFHIIQQSCKQDIALRPDGGVRVDLDVDSIVNISELHGFEKMTPEELAPQLIDMAQKEIANTITKSFQTARGLNADIYEFGTSIYRKYPKEWKAMKGRWDEIFRDIEFNVQVKAQIKGTGQIIQSLQMEGNMQ